MCYEYLFILIVIISNREIFIIKCYYQSDNCKSSIVKELKQNIWTGAMVIYRNDSW